MEQSVYAQIAARTGGDIYIGVVGPVRTGKSTFIKRVMETMVIPNIHDPYRRERAKDELPQSGSGRTIMTAEPKFVPEEAVELTPEENVRLRVRLIDSVGYMVPGAMGAMEDGKERMVTTPWADQEIPMSQAAELGTKKVMAEHCSVGVVVTTDGTVTDIPRQDYEEAEHRSVLEMKATGKPFVVILNSREPDRPEAKQLAEELSREYGVKVQPADCQTMDTEDFLRILTELLYAFPMTGMEVYLPRWLDALEWEHPVKKAVYDGLLENAQGIESLSQGVQSMESMTRLEAVSEARVRQIDLGNGTVSWEIRLPQELYYEILSQKTGLPISGEGELMQFLMEMAAAKENYDQFADALEQTQATGYGIVRPHRGEMKLEKPELMKKGGVHGVRLRAAAPTIHMMRVDLEAEVSPMVGSEQQARELVDGLTRDFGEDGASLWESNIFGKSLCQMVEESMDSKLNRMTEEVRMKFRSSLGKTVNEGANGMICILF